MSTVTLVSIGLAHVRACCEQDAEALVAVAVGLLLRAAAAHEGGSVPASVVAALRLVCTLRQHCSIQQLSSLQPALETLKRAPEVPTALDPLVPIIPFKKTAESNAHVEVPDADQYY